MLVLSRKKNQQIVIGDDIRVTVLSISGGNVRIGIDAPNDVRIIRSELRNPPISLPPVTATTILNPK